MTDELARVLVVEDNRDTSALLRDLLEAEGYQVESVGTGEAALEALEVNPETDLLVLDLMLPGMSGYEVIEKLRAEASQSRVPILVLSALSSPSARVRGLRDGADDYMTKLFLPEELVARARTLITSRLLERRTREIQALAQIAQASLTAADGDVRVQRMDEIVLDGDATDHRVKSRTLRSGKFRSVMAAPLIVGGVGIGVLEVARRSRRIDNRAYRFLNIVADRVAVAIEHSRLEGEARELANVVRRIGEGVVVIDTDDRVLFANRAFLSMVGAAGEDLTGQRWTDFLSSAQDTGALITQMPQQAMYHGELLLITRAGEPRPVHLSLSAVEQRKGGLQRIGIFRDISPEHELRFRVIREQKFRTLGSLAAGVAHNINNRLTPVLGWTEMLLERLGAGETIDSAELTHALKVISQGAADSVGTVRRLQEYSRPARVRGPEAVQLREVVEHLLALTRPQWDNDAARRGVRYEIDLRLEPAPAFLAVASEIREALLNILENALAAMPNGGRLTIQIGSEAERARIAITDTGRGMSAEVQRLAFEPFFTTRSGEGGTGLGLSLAQEIVQRYGGTITLQSREGVGTTFTLSFPPVTGELNRTTVFVPVVEPLRILAVEDEPDVLDLVRAMLTHAGHAVLTAASGREALTIFNRESVDLIITDLGMPGMTGLGLAAELRRIPRVPIVLLPGWP